MTTASMDSRAKGVGVVHAIVVGAAVLGALFILCWAGAAMGVVPATHSFVTLFVNAAPASTAALAGGLPWAVAFGALSGGVLAVFSNLFGFLARR